MVWKIPVHHPVTKGSYISLGAKFNGITFTSIVSGILSMDVIMLQTEAVLLCSSLFLDCCLICAFFVFLLLTLQCLQ